ncbi:glutamate decarboxylase gad1 [Paramarasmius palmivorus]|uniref:Glutamate decarboxylase n=1 Tax=Paramarasmius palmivorus TaxID=297713 RepID=A0AAW0CYP7_9AGAR
MALSKHINPDRLIADAHDKKTKHHVLSKTDPNALHHSYGARYGTNPIPKYHIPSKGIDADSAYQLVHDELALGKATRFRASLLLLIGVYNPDGSPVLNLASFVHTWMPSQADKLMQENMSKNLIDADEYPATQILHTRCISMLAHVWHAPHSKEAIGTATTGSSEAIQLGGLAMKKIWQEKRKAAGKSIHEPGPNIVMGANAQVALEKFARYFDVECRLVPISVESKYRLDPKKAMQYVDENTIGVFVILGSTYTGHYEPVKEMANLLDEYEKETGISVPIHVDAASGGFVAPFATVGAPPPDLVWDFKIPRVVSINTSGHKFGLSYVGVGWVVWRDKAHLPKDLIFELHYLGSVEYSFSLNFSRPAAPIIAQYFNLIHLGFEGYRNVALSDLRNARLLSRALEGSGYYTVLSDIHRPAQNASGPAGSIGSLAKEVGLGKATELEAESYEPGLPVVSFRFSDDFKQKYPELQQKWIQTLLRARGWIVPNYELAPDLQTVEILRVVVRENMSEVLIDRLVADLVEVTEQLMKTDSSVHALNSLGNAHSSRPEAVHGRMEKGEGSKPSGTYAKQC